MSSEVLELINSFTNKKREDYISQVRKYVLEKREENNLKLKSIKELFAQI